MEYKGTLIAVSDMERSKEFYTQVLGMKVEGDFGANVSLAGGVFLQTIDSWQTFINSRDVTTRSNWGELYFETTDIDGVSKRIVESKTKLLHPQITQSWGQKAIRFYDPDGHIVEIGEDLVCVMKRLRDQGMSDETIALRMDVPMEYVKERMK